VTKIPLDEVIRETDSIAEFFILQGLRYDTSVYDQHIKVLYNAKVYLLHYKDLIRNKNESPSD
jgi:hypothetical protein